MTTTRSRPPTRTSGYSGRRAAPRRRSGRGGRPSLRLPTLNLGWLFRPLGILAIALFIVGGLGLLLVVALPHIIRGSFTLLGAGVFVPPLAVAAIAFRWWRLRSGRAVLRGHWRLLVGGLLVYAGANATAALFRPEAMLGDVSLAEVTTTGLLGQLLLGEPSWLRAVRTLVPLALGVAIAFPRSLHLTWTGLLLAGAWVVALRLPQRSVAVTKAGVRRVRQRLAEANTQLVDDDDEEATPVVNAEASVTAEPRPLELRPLETAPEDEAPIEPPAAGRWELPAIGLLDDMDEVEVVDQSQRARQIEDALSSYGVDAKVVQINVGPAVTQFGIEPGWDVKTREIRERDVTGRFKLDRNGNPLVHAEEISRTRVKVERITGLSNNLALALAAPSVRIEAPVPGKNVVGIEVPNLTASMVSLRSVIETPTYQRLRSRAKLALALGQGVAGDVVVADLAKMPHLLIAGATGSGKSVCINTVICSIIMHASPDDVRFMMVDPKRVEMMPYSSIPHLLCPVIVEPERVVGTLQFVIREMEERYRKFAAIGVRNIEGFNKSPRAAEHMPYWVIIIDELADLMMVAPFEVEKSLCRLAQLARATGIHLVVATQRPSVDVITGLIKANFPTRISFAVSSQIDSRTILDAGGAEKLLGRGDMLYVPTDATKPKRVQGAYVSDTEVERIGMYWADDRFRDLRPKQFAEEVEQAIAAASGEGETDDDPLLDRARELAASSERVSTSFLQRRLRIGYPRASRLMEALRDEGYGDDSDDDGGY